MDRKSIPKSVRRRLYAESMGKCMNPDCQEDLFVNDGDIIEKAHIAPYFETQDNSYENLIILCPNCHKKFDKANLLDESTVKSWKAARQAQLNEFFASKYASFDELRNVVSPLLLENKMIYEEYFLKGKKALWENFEPKILSNNEKLKLLFKSNLDLFQDNKDENYSNLEIVRKFMLHVEEFKYTRSDQEKDRNLLFPEEINSIFGISPVSEYMLPSTEALEKFIKIMQQQNNFDKVELGIDNPYVLLKNGDKIYLTDTPRLRQIYYNYGCFRRAGVRLKNLNFALQCLKSRKIKFKYKNPSSLREIIINDVKMVFVYEYCLSKMFLANLFPTPKTVIVNLHNWNGQSCISQEAHELAKTLEVTLLTMEDFYKYVNQFR